MPPVARIKTVEKSNTSLTIKVGSHPIVYSVTTILALGAAVFFLVIAPLVRELQPGGSASVSDAQAANQAMKEKLESQKKLIEAVNSISEKNRELLAYSLPQEADAPGLIIQLNSVAIRSGVRMSSVDIASAAVGSTDSSSLQNPDDVPQAQSAKPLDIAYTVDGITYDKLKVLLSNLELSLRIFDVLSLNFSPSSASVSLQLRTYYLSGS